MILRSSGSSSNFSSVASVRISSTNSSVVKLEYLVGNLKHSSLVELECKQSEYE